MRLFTSLIHLSCLWTVSESYKIMVFSPSISRSHMISNGRIADALAASGHDVVLVEADFMNIHGNLNSSKLARRWLIKDFGNDLIDVLRGFSKDALIEDSMKSMSAGLLAYQRAYNNLCKDLLGRTSELAALKAEKFDGFFGEQINHCGNGLAYALGIKSHFWVSSCPISDAMAWVTGMPTPLSYLPATMAPDMDTRPTYWQRVTNLIGYYYYLSSQMLINNELTEIFRHKFGSDFPHLDEIAGNSDVIFVATDEFIEYPRPILPNVIHIGGLGEAGTQTPPLLEPFASEMEKGESGVIYFSLGTNLNTSILTATVKRNIVDLAKRFNNYHFIFKVDKYDSFVFDYGKKFSNVHITAWAPQPSILKHDRLRVFITHAGYNGVMEAARVAVPLLTIPFMFDQTRNSRSVAMGGWGLPITRQSLIKEPKLLGDTLQTLLNDTKYKKAAVRIQRLVTEKPFNATERLVKTTEFVLSMGGIKELLVEGRNLTFIKYYNLDIFIPFIIIITVVLYVSFRLLCCFMKCCFTTGYRKLKTK